MSALTIPVLLSLFAQCATDVAPETLNTLIGVESQRNPYAIAVVYDKNTKPSDRLAFKQPTNEKEAMNIIAALQNLQNVKSYSVGLMQINSSNFSKFNINNNNMFNVCKNIETGAAIFKQCYTSAKNNNTDKNEQELLRIAASCYYSGNERTGFKIESSGTSYVGRINETIAKNYIVPAIKPLNHSVEQSDFKTEMSLKNSTQDESPKRVKTWDIFEDYPSNY